MSAKRPAGPAAGSAPKKWRSADDDDDDYDDLDEMIDDEENIAEEDMLAMMPPPEEDDTLSCLGSKDMSRLAARWKRPPLPPLDPATDSLSFQQIETDYSVSPLAPEFARDSSETRAAVIRMFGVTDAGNSVVAHVHGFRPYFYARAPPGFTPQDIPAFQANLSAKLKAAASAKDTTVNPIVHVALVNKQSIMHFAFGQAAPFLRIVTALPSLVATSRRTLENGVPVPRCGSFSFETYESNWAYALRYMVDRDIVGCNWVTATAGKWRARPWNSSDGKRIEPATHCQLEIDIWFSDLESHAPDGEWLGIAPLRILSFDIECAGRPGIFPEAEKDPVIQIANYVSLQGQKTPVVKNVFTLKECAPISGAQVLSFDSEAEMLRAWHQFLIDSDADILTGYNIVNFDLPYLLNR